MSNRQISFQARAVSRNYSERSPYTVRIGGTVVRRGVISIIHIYYPSQRVFEGTDAFVNFCINDSKMTYSSGGRLFCYRPAFADAEVRALKRYVSATSGGASTVSAPTTTTPPKPASRPPGATAKCNDGTYSYSAHHSGSCSHHGGVAVFYT
jgi:hypothetical protein